MGELIDVDQAGPGDDELDADAAEDARQLGDQLELARRARGEVGVAALGRERHEPAVDVVQHRDAEPGAGRDHRRVAARHGDALLQHRELVALEHRHRVGQRLEIVDDLGALQAERRAHRFAVDEPRHVGQPRHLIGDGAGDADARRRDRARVDFPGAEELAHHRLEAVVVERDELADLDRRGPIRLRREQPEQRLGAADVAGQ